VIIWINGTFGAGKTTLAQELHRRLPDAVLFDPEYIGYVLQQTLPNYQGDFQHLPSWRELVVATALSLRRHEAGTLIVPMTLVNAAYQKEIFTGLAEDGEKISHVFLDLDEGVLRRRINERIVSPDHPERESGVRAFCLSHVDAGIAAARSQPEGTLLLRSDQLTPPELADQVLSRAETQDAGSSGTM
jgi:hypothetical protein